ncbi:MAG TPA: uracil-DNA glycosylase [Thermoanaerobaculia bacterium]
MARFDRFIDALARAKVSDRACNQYTNAIRRENLRLYLLQIGEPRMLLVGEAPSHRGGRLTGIAFTSEQIMLSGVDGRFLGENRGYRKATPGPKRSTEASATMVWATIKNIEPLPLLWNAFPFHPFVTANPFSNRIPTAGELLLGAPFLTTLMTLFPIEVVVAIGNLAERSLTRLGIPHTKVRHPSQGGKRKFVEGVLALAADA